MTKSIQPQTPMHILHSNDRLERHSHTLPSISKMVIFLCHEPILAKSLDYQFPPTQPYEATQQIINHLLFVFLVILGIYTRMIKGIGHGGGTPQKEEGTENEVPWRWHCFCCYVVCVVMLFEDIRRNSSGTTNYELSFTKSSRISR